MGVVSRPTSYSDTVNAFQFGLPYIYFGQLITGTTGSYGAYTSVGVVEDFAINRDMKTAPQYSYHSGRQELIREIVQMFGFSWEVSVKGHLAQNLQYLLASSSLTAVAAGNTPVTGQQFSLTDDEEDFVYIGHPNIDESTIVPTCAEIVDEAVGTGQGTPYGETLGQFALDYKVNAVGDVTELWEGSNERSGDIVSGSSPGVGEIGLTTGTGVDSGKLIWPSGEGPASGDAIVATYTPSFSFAQNTDWIAQPKTGYLRMYDIGTEATDALRAFQPMVAAYTYAEVDHYQIVPGTQGIFEGRAKLQLITDVGINWLWDVPRCSLRMPEEAMPFGKDDAAVQKLIFSLLSAGGSTPYGTIDHYDETAY